MGESLEVSMGEPMGEGEGKEMSGVVGTHMALEVGGFWFDMVVLIGMRIRMKISPLYSNC